MSTMHPSCSLQTHEISALYGEPEDFYEDYERGSQRCATSLSGGASSARDSQGEREKRGTARHGVYFSNREYYWRLEELKAVHLRNMTELERMNIREANDDQGLEGREDGSDLDPRTLTQRMDSQEELYSWQTSSASGQAEDRGLQDSHSELELDMEDPPRTSSKEKPPTRHRQSVYPERVVFQKQAWNQSKASTLKPQAGHGKKGRLQGLPARSVRTHSPSKVTVPKPFQMMVREQERKFHKVRTRSQVELENTLLRKELNELKECGKRFRASPVPAHTHLPLTEVVGRRPNQGLGLARGNRSGGHRGNGGNRADGGDHGNQTTERGRRVNASPSPSTQPPQPFSFLEREKKKREEKMESVLENLSLRDEQRLFKARPIPSNMYNLSLGQQQGKEWLEDTKSSGLSTPPRRPPLLAYAAALPGATEKKTRDTGPGSLEPEERFHSREDSRALYSSSCRAQRRQSVKKQIELSIEMMKEKEWAYIDPLNKAGSEGSSQGSKTDYISV